MRVRGARARELGVVGDGGDLCDGGRAGAVRGHARVVRLFGVVGVCSGVLALLARFGVRGRLGRVLLLLVAERVLDTDVVEVIARQGLAHAGRELGGARERRRHELLEEVHPRVGAVRRQRQVQRVRLGRARGVHEAARQVQHVAANKRALRVCCTCFANVRNSV